jgi:uncharacterized protein
MTPFRVLAVSDEVDESLNADRVRRSAPDMVVSCGDLPFDYLEFLVTLANVPLLYVPGNHDPEVAGRSRGIGLADAPVLVTGRPTAPILLPAKPASSSRGPHGCVNADGRLIHAAGLRVGGLGGSLRYREGPNLYTQKQMARRARRLARRARAGRFRGHALDLLVTHAPPFGLGDEEDPAHRGFEAFHRLVDAVRPQVLVHGHVHPHGRPRPDRFMGNTLVVNAVPTRILLLER